MKFELTPQEQTDVYLWSDDHDCKITYEGAVGGKLTYCFAPMSLGMVTKVQCACGQELDLTDYSEW